MCWRFGIIRISCVRMGKIGIPCNKALCHKCHWLLHITTRDSWLVSEMLVLRPSYATAYISLYLHSGSQNNSIANDKTKGSDPNTRYEKSAFLIAWLLIALLVAQYDKKSDPPKRFVVISFLEKCSHSTMLTNPIREPH